MVRREKLLYAIADNIVLFIFGIFFTITTVRALSPQEYGYYVAAFSIVVLLDIFTGGFMNLATVKFGTDSMGDELTQVFWTVLTVKTVMMLIIGIGIYLTAGFIAGLFGIPDLVTLLYLTPVIGFVSSFRQTTQYVLVAKQRLRELFLCDFLGLFCSVIFLMTALHFDWLNTASFVLIAFALCTTFFVTGTILFTRDIYRLTTPSLALAKKLSTFGGYTLLSASSSYLLERVDGWIILYFLSPGALGAYDATRKISEGIIRNVVNTFSYVTYPLATEAANNFDIIKLKEIYEFYSSLILLVCLPLGIVMVFLSSELVGFAYGEKYVSTGFLVVIFGVGAFFRPFAQIGGNVLDSMGKPNLTFGFTFIGALLTITLNFLFIPIYGITAAAIASTVFFVMNSILLHLYLRKHLSVELSRVVHYGKKILTQVNSLLKYSLHKFRQ